jgi:hypothetical protein
MAGRPRLTCHAADADRLQANASRRQPISSGWRAQCCVIRCSTDGRKPYLGPVASRTLPQRFARAVGESALSERVARSQGQTYASLIERVRRGPLHSDVLGHSLHPSLTDVTIGCWLSTSVLDLAGGPQSRHGATLLTGAGLLASVPTALAGAVDWEDLTGAERRIGAVHGLCMDSAMFFFAGSLVARLRGGYRVGTTLAIAGNVVIAGAAFLGGHLALHHGAARRTPNADPT